MNQIPIITICLACLIVSVTGCKSTPSVQGPTDTKTTEKPNLEQRQEGGGSSERTSQTSNGGISLYRDFFAYDPAGNLIARSLASYREERPSVATTQRATTQPSVIIKSDQGAEVITHAGPVIRGMDNAKLGADGSAAGTMNLIDVVDEQRARIFYGFACICFIMALVCLYFKQLKMAGASAAGVILFAVLPQLTGKLAWVLCAAAIPIVGYGLWWLYQRQALARHIAEQQTHASVHEYAARAAMAKGDAATAEFEQAQADAIYKTLDPAYKAGMEKAALNAVAKEAQ